MEGLLEIDSLSEEDRDIILKVLKRDDEVRKTQELKANQLKVEIQSLRMQSVLRPGDNLSKICARCHGELGVIFNRGDICPKCRFRVCNRCKETMFKGSWLCNLCFKQRQLKLLTGEWAAGPSSGLKQWASGTDLVKASIIYKDHPPLVRKQDFISVKNRDQVLQKKQGVESSSNISGPRAIGGQEIRKSPAKSANKIEVQKEHTNGVVNAQETERVEYPKDTDKQRLSQLLNFIRAKKPSPAETQENSREMNVRRITSRNHSDSSESSSSSSETDDDIGSSYQPSLRSSSVSPPVSEVDYEVQMSESARLQSVHEENFDIEGDGRNQVVKPATLEQLTLESSAINVTSRDISPKEKSKFISDHQKSDTKTDVSTEEKHVKSSPSSLSDKSNTNAKMSITTSCEVHTSSQSDQSQLQLTSIPGDDKIQSGITSADLPLGRSSSPISVSMDSLSSSHPSPSMSHSTTADLLDKGSMHDASDTEPMLQASQQEMTELMGTKSVVQEGSVHDTSDTISTASQREMSKFMGMESVVREGSVDDDYVLEEISKVKFRRISQASKHSEGQGPRFSHSPQRLSRPEGFTAEVEGPRSHSGLQRVSEQFEEGRKGTECQNPFTKLSSETAGKVYCDLSIKAVDPNFAQDSEIKISQLSHLPNITSTAVGKDMSSIMDRSTYSNAHQNQFAGSSLSNTASHSIHGSCVDVVNNLACDTLSGNQSSIHSHVIKYADVSSKDNTEITTQKGSKGMTLLDTTLPVRNRYLSERSVSDADSIGSFNLSPITPIPQSSLEANTGVYTITYFDSDDALEDPAVEEPENDDCVIQWTEESKSTQIDERPQSLTLDKDQNRGEVPREMDYIGIKEEAIPGYSSLWYVQGIDASKEEFDRLFNQEDKIMKSSKGGYLTRSSSEDSDVLSIIHEQDEEAETSMENVETREEHILYDAYSASEGGMTDALKPNNKSAFDCKKQPSHFLDIPETRDSSSVLFAEHSVKINQEVSNEESFISLDLSNIPDISLDDILAVNRKMFAVGDSDDGDLEEILAYCMGSCQESQQQHKELPKPNKSSTSDTDIASLDISQKKKATREHTAEKEQVYLSEVFQHPHEQTVIEGKEFSTRCFVEPSLLNENACTSEDTAKSVSHKMFTLQHPKEVSAKSVSAKMDTPQQPTEVSAKSVSAKMDTPQQPTEVCVKSVSAKMDTPQHPTEVSVNSVSTKMGTPQHITEVSAKSVSVKMVTPQHPKEVSVKSVSAKMDTPQHTTEVSAKSVSAKMDTPQHPTEVSAKSLSAMMDATHHPKEVSAKSVSAKMGTMQHPAEVSVKSVSAEMDTPQHPTEVSAKSVSAKMDTPQQPTELSVKSVSAKMDTPQHPKEVSAKSVSAKIDTPQHPTEVSVNSVSAKMDTPQHPTEVSVKSVSAKMDTPQHPTEVSAKSVSAKMDTPQHPTEVSAKSLSAMMDATHHPKEVSAKSVSAKMDTPQNPTEVSVKSVSAKMDTPQHPKEVSSKSMSAKMDTIHHPKEVSVKSVSAKMGTMQHPTEVTDFKDDSISVNDEKSLSQVIAEHPDEVVRECKEEKQTHDITAVHLYSECDNKSNLISDLIIEHDQFSEHLSKNSHRTPTDQSSERLEHQISVDQSTSERQKSQISIDQDTRVAPHEEDVIEQEEQVLRDKTISTNDLEVSMNKLPHERTVIEESNVVCDPEKSSKNTAEWSLGYLSLESHVIDSVIISEQMFLPECIDYVIQPPEEFSDVDHMAPSTACHSVASQQDGDDLHQHQVSQQDADDLHQHQPLQQDADYLSTHVSEDAADAEIGLNVKDPQTLEKVETQKRGEKWDDVHVNKANIVLTLSSGLDSCSEEFVGKIGKKENIVNETDSAFHPDQNLADAQDGKEGLFSFQESSKACFMIPMIGVDMVETEKRTAPVERSESSTSQDDSGHVSLPTSVDHTPEHKRTDSGYSQSSIPSTQSTATDRSEEEDIDTLVASAKSNFGSRGNLLSVIADSRESIVSYYSDAGDISHSNIPVTGEVLFGLNYNYKTGMLEIAVKQCKAIAPADTKRKRSDPYVKTYLLPDKTRSGKRKTKVKKHTLSPIFDEVLKYSVSKSELENRTLWLSVWHNDRFGRNDFLGEVTINFDYYKFDDPTPRWYPLQERATNKNDQYATFGMQMDSQQPSMLTYKGDLILSICFVTTPDNKKGQQNVDRGQLHVMIKEAHNLTAVKSNGYSDPFCKGYLLPERHRNSKQKTPVVKKNCNPVWNYKMVFEDMSRTELAERCLELTIWDHEKLASNDFLGGVRLNLGTGLYQGKLVDWMDSKGEEISLWQAILDRPNLWIDSTLILRPNMQKRKF